MWLRLSHLASAPDNHPHLTVMLAHLHEKTVHVSHVQKCSAGNLVACTAKHHPMQAQIWCSVFFAVVECITDKAGILDLQVAQSALVMAGNSGLCARRASAISPFAFASAPMPGGGQNRPPGPGAKKKAAVQVPRLFILCQVTPPRIPHRSNPKYHWADTGGKALLWCGRRPQTCMAVRMRAFG